MEILKEISYIVWIGVGITMIGGSIYSLVWMRKFYKGFLGGLKEKAE